MIIGITGKKRAGKNTAATILANVLTNEGNTVVITAYAKLLKQAILHGLTVGNVKDWNGKHFTFEDLDGETSFDRERVFLSFHTTLEIVKTALSYLHLPYKDSVSGALAHSSVVKLNPPMYSIRTILQIFGTEIVRTLYQDDFWIAHVESEYKALDDTNAIMLVTDARFDNEVEMIHRNGGKMIEIFTTLNNNESKDVHASESGVSSVDIRIENPMTIDGLTTNIIANKEKLWLMN